MDAVTAFWSDMMGRMAPQGWAGMAGANQGGPSPFPGMAMTPEAMKQFRNGFMEAWAKSCDEYMRSDQFLGMMKQSMDNALAFRQQMNSYLTKCLEDAQVPSRNDTDALMRVLRSTEERLLDKFDKLMDRLESLEQRVSGGEPSRPPFPQGTTPAPNGPTFADSGSSAAAKSGGASHKGKKQA